MGKKVEIIYLYGRRLLFFAYSIVFQASENSCALQKMELSLSLPVLCLSEVNMNVPHTSFQGNMVLIMTVNHELRNIIIEPLYYHPQMTHRVEIVRLVN